MSTSSRIAAPASGPVRGQLYRAAIVGAATLKGKEVAEMLGERKFPAADVRLLDDDESIGQLEASGDEVNFIQSVRTEQFERVDFTFFAGDRECTRKTWKTARHAGSTIVDLSGALEDAEGASVRSLWVERERGVVVQPELQPGPCVTAHPVAVILALLLLRARKIGGVQRAVTTIFEPASERGQKGMDELHQQTVNLLSFQPLPKDVYDTQVAFNLVARYGANSQPSVESLEAQVLRHFRKIAGEGLTQPSLMVLQAPVFHGHALALYVEMDRPVDAAELQNALAGEHVSIPGAEDEAPSNVSSAGQGNILLAVRPDASQRNGAWLWAAADNLRIAAITAVECAESMIGTRPLGKIQ
ncbi:MAG TPA: Asd/ArgC dimerization domain-containing protein [Candidatus Aquilonibacter sp.]|nr:Asd/ArgC dimerization domain-containing protein [Candidatus Aquilonibacter sp.]